LNPLRKLGLIGGLGPGATVHYYKELVNAKAGEMMIIQADMDHVLGCVQRGERLELAEYFARLIDRLAGGGAESLQFRPSHLTSVFASSKRFRHCRS
jgi:aspartate racemase